MLLLPSIATIFALFLFTSCKHDPLTPLSDAPVISFQNEVQPIIISNCTQSDCHDGGRNITLITYNDILNEVSPSDPHGSKLYDAITSNSIGTMPKPPNPRLSNTDIKKIYLWILQGAQNN